MVAEKPKRWGQGRIVFMSELPEIRAEISRAVPMTEVFASRSDRLGIGYSAFCKLVSKYAPDAKIHPATRQDVAGNRAAHGMKPTAGNPPPPQRTAPVESTPRPVVQPALPTDDPADEAPNFPFVKERR